MAMATIIKARKKYGQFLRHLHQRPKRSVDIQIHHSCRQDEEEEKKGKRKKKKKGRGRGITMLSPGVPERDHETTWRQRIWHFE